MKIIAPPFTITNESAHLFKGLHYPYCRSCKGYKTASGFSQSYITSEWATCLSCRRKHEKISRTKTPEERILHSLRQRLRKLDPKLSKQWKPNDITTLFTKYNPTRNPKLQTVVRINVNAPFLPPNAQMVSRGEAKRIACATQ